jgi:hypothetical protein
MVLDLLVKGIEFLSKVENAGKMPNFPFPTMGGEYFWIELAHYNGWRVQENQFTHLCRILNPNNVRFGWGGYKAMMELFERILRNNSQLSLS